MSNKEKVIEFLNSNHGYITTAEFLTLGMSKPLIQKFLDEGLIERVSYG
ncbi:MAG: type IV toxin-antitoxin system AbiEi family antitoxin domain-containing protein, partial [Bacilli bacterium]|nr:type IV toxin-antitoxin system AbiEi family antitoxin domain-containing protein [Bacilli bacterium]